MWAAAEGHSNLGIPEAVGKEYVHADAAGKPEEGDLTDHETAEGMRDGELPSPQRFGDFWLFDVRITGTGVAYRDSIDEWAIRDPKKWLSDEFVDRCNGLAVIFGHPERSGLNHEEFRERSIGSIVLPYIKGDEVWGIAKIFDADAAALMQTTHRSTSPGVTPPQGSQPITLEDGTKVLPEGLPLILDHLAICEAGVWDKEGPPEGIRLDASPGKVHMAEEDLEKELKDARARIDEFEKADKARKDAAAEEERKDKARRDAEQSDKEAIEKAEKEKADKAKKDARRKDWEERKDGESEEDYEKRQDSRMDDESEEEFDARKKDRKAKKDAAGAQIETVDPERGMDVIKDSKQRFETLERNNAELQRQLAEIKAGQKPLTMDERNEIAKAFHRADSLYQMLGDATPHNIQGETPIAYRRRLAAGLRKYSDRWKDYTIHDSLDATAFELIEKHIYDDARAFAKNPSNGSAVGVLREVKDTTTMPGKTITRFYGDARAAWTAFMPPMRTYLTKLAAPPKG